MTPATQGPDAPRQSGREDTIAAYLSDAFESGDPAIVADALGIIARTRGLATVAQEAGLPRESLYRDLSADACPDFGLVLKVTQALGLKLVAVVAE